MKQVRNAQNQLPMPITRRVLLQDVIDKLVEHRHDPIVSLIKLAQDESADRRLRFLADKELAARIVPPMKAITISATDGDSVAAVKELKEKLVGALEKYRQDY